MAYYYKSGVIVPFVQKFYKQMIIVVAGLFIASMASMTFNASAAVSTVTVTGNTVDTSLGENGSEGWWFNRDANTDTPFSFVNGNQKIGVGSLYVPPIGATAADKFIAEYFAFEQMGDVETFSFDFKTNSAANDTKEEQFYLNVYANFAESDPKKFYDCRYNIVATTGSSIMYNTVTFDVDTAVANVTTRLDNVNTTGVNEASPQTCPAVPSAMGDDAVVRVFAINLGDTSLNDSGVGGYFDNVVYQTNTDTTTYDFERALNTLIINSPLESAEVSGDLVLSATYDDGEEDKDSNNWGLRPDSTTCSTGSNFFGGGPLVSNVLNSTSDESWDGETFSATVDTTKLVDGDYCFVINPTDDANQNDTRAFVSFTVRNNVYQKEECKDGGWMMGLADGTTFKNQGHCVSHFASNEKSTNARNKNN